MLSFKKKDCTFNDHIYIVFSNTLSQDRAMLCRARPPPIYEGAETAALVKSYPLGGEGLLYSARTEGQNVFVASTEVLLLSMSVF